MDHANLASNDLLKIWAEEKETRKEDKLLGCCKLQKGGSMATGQPLHRHTACYIVQY